MGAGKRGDFGNTTGNALDALSNLLAAASLIPGIDSFIDLASIPVDLLRGDFISAGLDAAGIIPILGEGADTARLARMTNNAIDATRAMDKATDIEKLSKKAGSIAKRSPLRVPKKAEVKVQAKNRYNQIKYTWETGKYKYTSRWHTRTPNAPKTHGTSWVVERRTPGIGYGKNFRSPKEEVLVGKNKWISKVEWKEAITAKSNGTATKQQKEWIENGHWKD